MSTSQANIRRRILKERGVALDKHTKRPRTIDDQPASYKKSRLMKYVELKQGKPIDQLLFTVTLDEVAKKLGIDRTTVSKWRKLISEAKEKEFFGQFK